MIVVGADTPIGREVVEAFVEPNREVRAFITNPGAVEELRALGVKVALGDVSDSSHVGGACTNCFSAVLVTEAATDGRERSFAATPEEVLDAWADAVRESHVTRVIWVSERISLPDTGITETVVIDVRSVGDPVSEVVRLDDAAELTTSEVLPNDGLNQQSK